MSKVIYICAFGLMLIASPIAIGGTVDAESLDGEHLHEFIERVSLEDRAGKCGFIRRENGKYAIGAADCNLLSGRADIIVYHTGNWRRLAYAPVDASINVNGKSLPGRVLAEITAPKALSQDEFASALAEPIAQYTKQLQHEVCAQICKSSDGTWGATITTVGSHVMCPITGACPSGMTPTGEGIHSHPTGGSYNLNDADKAVLLSGPFYRLGAKEQRGKTDVFSPEDFKSGPGYMVTDKGRLMHQDGPKKVRIISIGM